MALSLDLAASLADRLKDAVAEGDADRVAELMESGAALTPDKDGRTPLHQAAFHGHHETCKVLAEAGCDIDSQDSWGCTALHRAVLKGHVEAVKSLVALKAGLDRTDDVNGNTALHEAAWNGYSRCVEVLVRAKANIYIRNRTGFSPLHLASQNGHNQSARTIILAGCNPDIKNAYGDTSLHTAARYGHAGVSRILISAKCTVDDQNKNGDTALHIAAALRKRKIAKILVEAAADVNVRNNQGETPADVARRMENPDVIGIIINTKPLRRSTSRPSRPPVTFNPNLETEAFQQNSGKQKSTGKLSRFFGLKRSKSSSDDGLQEKPEKPVSGIMVHGRGAGGRHPPPKHRYPKEPGIFHPAQLIDPNEVHSFTPKSGMTFYRDLAGNVHEGPRGYDAMDILMPFMKGVEDQVDGQRKEMMRKMDVSYKTLDAKIERLDKKMTHAHHAGEQAWRQALAAQRGETAEALDRRAKAERENWWRHQGKLKKDLVHFTTEMQMASFERMYGDINSSRERGRSKDGAGKPARKQKVNGVAAQRRGVLFRSRSDETLSEYHNKRHRVGRETKLGAARRMKRLASNEDEGRVRNRNDEITDQMQAVIAELGRFPLPVSASGQFAATGADDDDDDDDYDDELTAEERAYRKWACRRRDAARSLGDLVAAEASLRVEEEDEEEEEEEEARLGAAGGKTGFPRSITAPTLSRRRRHNSAGDVLDDFGPAPIPPSLLPAPRRDLTPPRDRPTRRLDDLPSPPAQFAHPALSSPGSDDPLESSAEAARLRPALRSPTRILAPPGNQATTTTRLFAGQSHEGQSLRGHSLGGHPDQNLVRAVYNLGTPANPTSNITPFPTSTPTVTNASNPAAPSSPTRTLPRPAAVRAASYQATGQAAKQNFGYSSDNYADVTTTRRVWRETNLDAQPLASPQAAQPDRLSQPDRLPQPDHFPPPVHPTQDGHLLDPTRLANSLHPQSIRPIPPTQLQRPPLLPRPTLVNTPNLLATQPNHLAAPHRASALIVSHDDDDDDDDDNNNNNNNIVAASDSSAPSSAHVTPRDFAASAATLRRGPLHAQISAATSAAVHVTVDWGGAGGGSVGVAGVVPPPHASPDHSLNSNQSSLTTQESGYLTPGAGSRAGSRPPSTASRPGSSLPETPSEGGTPATEMRGLTNHLPVIHPVAIPHPITTPHSVATPRHPSPQNRFSSPQPLPHPSPQPRFSTPPPRHATINARGGALPNYPNFVASPTTENSTTTPGQSPASLYQVPSNNAARWQPASLAPRKFGDGAAADNEINEGGIRLELSPIASSLNNSSLNNNNSNVNRNVNNLFNINNINTNGLNNNNNNNRGVASFHPPQTLHQLLQRPQQMPQPPTQQVRRSPLQNGVVASLQGMQNPPQGQQHGPSLLRPPTPGSRQSSPHAATPPPRSNSRLSGNSLQSSESAGKSSQGGASSPHPYVAALGSAMGQLHLTKNAAPVPNLVHNNLRNGSSLAVSNNDLRQPTGLQQHLGLQQISFGAPQDLGHIRGSEV